MLNNCRKCEIIMEVLIRSFMKIWTRVDEEDQHVKDGSQKGPKKPWLIGLGSTRSIGLA